MIRASGRGSLHSYVISHLPAPGFEPPYTIAVVKLDEGPIFLSNPKGFGYDDIESGMPVKLTFIDCEDQAGEFKLPVFERA